MSILHNFNTEDRLYFLSKSQMHPHHAPKSNSLTQVQHIPHNDPFPHIRRRQLKIPHKLANSARNYVPTHLGDSASPSHQSALMTQ